MARNDSFYLVRPRTALIVLFLVWKLLLFLIALVAPGPGYDTSTFLLDGWSLDLRSTRTQSYGGRETVSGSAWVASRLVRWDAIYFTQTAKRGYVFEQEWAFGWGFSKAIAFITQYLSVLWKGRQRPDIDTAVAGILLANVAHALSTLILFELSRLMFVSQAPSKVRTIPFTAACLHIISPAGLFLIAPYAESSFAALNFAGFYFYLKSTGRPQKVTTPMPGVFLTLCGGCFGLATTLRGNGIFSGLTLVYEAAALAVKVILRQGSTEHISRMLLVIFAGLIMAALAVLPQYVAYTEYCRPVPQRLWCQRWIPSIYTWVQSHYWGVGFLHYWTISNLPLFLLAAPMLSIMLASSLWAWTSSVFPAKRETVAASEGFTKDTSEARSSKNQTPTLGSPITQAHMIQLAVPQIVLAILAILSYHVQIITRLSSGYPVWYWWLAWSIHEDQEVVILRKKFKPAVNIVRWMTMYAIIQGGLFASFLPPA